MLKPCKLIFYRLFNYKTKYIVYYIMSLLSPSQIQLKIRLGLNVGY